MMWTVDVLTGDVKVVGSIPARHLQYVLQHFRHFINIALISQPSC